MNLFVYGTLKDKKILSFVLGREYMMGFADASLPDFRLEKPHFFMVFEQPGASVVGKIIFGLSTSDFARLDVYEGVEMGLYRRKEVTVNTEGGIQMPAFVYYNGETRINL